MRKLMFVSVITATVLSLTPELAHAAASADWIKPATTLVETLRTGVVQIGAALVGLGIVAIGVWMGISGRGEWSRLGYAIAGGILIMAGPEAIATLLEATQS